MRDPARDAVSDFYMSACNCTTPDGINLDIPLCCGNPSHLPWEGSSKIRVDLLGGPDLFRHLSGEMPVPFQIAIDVTLGLRFEMEQL